MGKYIFFKLACETDINAKSPLLFLCNSQKGGLVKIDKETFFSGYGER